MKERLLESSQSRFHVTFITSKLCVFGQTELLNASLIGVLVVVV